MPGDLDFFEDNGEIMLAPQWGDSPRCSDGSWAIDETRGGGETSGGGEAEAVNSVPPERQPAEDIPTPSSRRSDLSMASSARAARSDRSAASSAQARGRAMASAIRAERSFAEESEYFHRLMDEVRSDVASTRQARQNTRSSRRPMTTRTRPDRQRPYKESVIRAWERIMWRLDRDRAHKGKMVMLTAAQGRLFPIKKQGLLLSSAWGCCPHPWGQIVRGDNQCAAWVKCRRCQARLQYRTRQQLTSTSEPSMPVKPRRRTTRRAPATAGAPMMISQEGLARAFREVPVAALRPLYERAAEQRRSQRAQTSSDVTISDVEHEEEEEEEEEQGQDGLEAWWNDVEWSLRPDAGFLDAGSELL